MAVSKVSFGVVSFVAVLIFTIMLPAVQAHDPSTSDGTAIDQGIAYILMLVALVLTYLIHTLDTPSNSLF